jgi:hypothetical protein
MVADERGQPGGAVVEAVDLDGDAQLRLDRRRLAIERQQPGAAGAPNSIVAMAATPSRTARRAA